MFGKNKPDFCQKQAIRGEKWAQKRPGDDSYQSIGPIFYPPHTAANKTKGEREFKLQFISNV